MIKWAEAAGRRAARARSVVLVNCILLVMKIFATWKVWFDFNERSRTIHLIREGLESSSMFKSDARARFRYEENGQLDCSQNNIVETAAGVW